MECLEYKMSAPPRSISAPAGCFCYIVVCILFCVIAQYEMFFQVPEMYSTTQIVLFFFHSIPSPMFFNNILRCLRIYLRCHASIHLKVSSSIGTSSNGRSACQLPSQGSCKTEAACPYTRPDTNLGVGADIGPMIYD